MQKPTKREVTAVTLAAALGAAGGAGTLGPSDEEIAEMVSQETMDAKILVCNQYARRPYECLQMVK